MVFNFSLALNIFKFFTRMRFLTAVIFLTSTLNFILHLVRQFDELVLQRWRGDCLRWEVHDSVCKFLR